jgi:hypothetical protein
VFGQTVHRQQIDFFSIEELQHSLRGDVPSSRRAELIAAHVEGYAGLATFGGQENPQLVEQTIADCQTFRKIFL